MKGLYRGFCRNENGAETIVLNGEKIKGEWVQGYFYNNAENIVSRENLVTTYILCFDSQKVIHGLGNLGAPNFIKVIPETVCEAVRGLTDRNGKQVFENDVVTTMPLSLISCGYEHNYIGKVIWTNEDVASCGCCYPSFKGCGYVLKAKYERLRLDNDCEVIGTIFDEQFAEG